MLKRGWPQPPKLDQTWAQKSPWMCETCGNAAEENQKVIECFKCKECFHKECTALKEVEYDILENNNDSKQWRLPRHHI